MKNHIQLWVRACLSFALLMTIASSRADDTKKEEQSDQPSREQLIKNLEKTLTGAKLVGQFTVTG